MNIKTPEDLKIAVDKALVGDKNIIWDIGNYKWYNFYTNTHIESGSPDDIKNQEIFNYIEREFPDLHCEIEKVVESKIAKYDLPDEYV